MRPLAVRKYLFDIAQACELVAQFAAGKSLEQYAGDRTIARELVVTVRQNVTIDWTVRESVHANLRRLVRRVLRRHGYPPDKQERATQTVLEQAELLSREWAA